MKAVIALGAVALLFIQVKASAIDCECGFGGWRPCGTYWGNSCPKTTCCTTVPQVPCPTWCPCPKTTCCSSYPNCDCACLPCPKTTCCSTIPCPPATITYFGDCGCCYPCGKTTACTTIPHPVGKTTTCTTVPHPVHIAAKTTTCTTIPHLPGPCCGKSTTCCSTIPHQICEPCLQPCATKTICTSLPCFKPCCSQIGCGICPSTCGLCNSPCSWC